MTVSLVSSRSLLRQRLGIGHSTRGSVLLSGCRCCLWPFFLPILPWETLIWTKKDAGWGWPSTRIRDPQPVSVFVQIILSSKWTGVSLKVSRRNWQETGPGEEKVNQLFNTNSNKWHFNRFLLKNVQQSIIHLYLQKVTLEVFPQASVPNLQNPNPKLFYECRCNGRLQTKRCTHLSHTGLVVELEHLKIKTRLTNEKFASVKGECEI